MRRYALLLVATFAVFLVIGCYGEQTEEPAAKPEPEAEATVETAMVEVAATGTEFDPPIEVDRLPEGVWYCDMGTTHYARAEKSEDPCPVCGMTLVEKRAAEPEETETGSGS